MITCLLGVAIWPSALVSDLGTFGGTAFAAENADANTYDQDSVVKDAAEFFGESAEGLAKVIEKAFKEYGQPNAYIKGEEASGALTVGLRYGDGTLVSKSGESRKVYWSGPSIPPAVPCGYRLRYDHFLTAENGPAFALKLNSDLC